MLSTKWSLQSPYEVPITPHPPIFTPNSEHMFFFTVAGKQNKTTKCVCVGMSVYRGQRGCQIPGVGGLGRLRATQG